MTFTKVSRKNNLLQFLVMITRNSRFLGESDMIFSARGRLYFFFLQFYIIIYYGDLQKGISTVSTKFSTMLDSDFDNSPCMPFAKVAMHDLFVLVLFI